MEKQMMNVQQTAQQWNLSVRRVQALCSQGRIPGAVQFGRSWMIPADAPRPADGRTRQAHTKANEPPMPRKSPYLCMTDIYSVPGSAAKVSRSLQDNLKAKRRFDAGIAYCQGDVDMVSDHAMFFLNNHTGTYAMLGAGLLLGFCAVWKGEAGLWKEARRHIASIPLEGDGAIDIGELVLTVMGINVVENNRYPQWFDIGCFDRLPPDSHPFAKVYYCKYLYLGAYAIASRQYVFEGIQGLGMMRILPNIYEPLISQAVVEKTLIPQIHMRLCCAAAYHDSGQDEQAISHIDKAIALALPDRLLGILAEYWQQLDTLLEQRLLIQAPELVRRTRELHRQYTAGKATLNAALKNRKMVETLTAREREIAKLIAFGFTNRRVAKALGISESTVKSVVKNIMLKTGAQNRLDFVTIL